ncbi:ABC transporter substrate-binding protein [Mesorhizobium ciceri]|uniref:Substrate-binding region of ABC-type glycine betaine transport system n=1 Tax=Mesorhizobium ciceri biovar biserrulae (strain HAMBI 2942 / LMG 23838 / WSM1271) TaxID=765698 RepID=E8TMV0_MESCW|nr:Substrate-binding region of ABC-type glycine betaine transport system [Mesorhizobium ciceri biovar biserrulae WSM1271]
MKNLPLAAACLTILVLESLPANAASNCGELTISSMNWQSAEVLASLDKFILKAGFGCDAEILEGDTVPTVTSMIEKGKPDVAPEIWVDLLPDVVATGIKLGKLVETGAALKDGGVNGWWIPKYVSEAHPDIKTIADALKHPELFPAPEDSSKGAVFNGPQGWGATVVTTQLFKAYGAEKAGFTLIDTGSAAGLDGSIAKSYERHQGWLGFYWAPTSILGKYEMVKLDFGVPYNQAEWKRCNTVADCADPKPNVWPQDRVKTIVTKGFSDRTDPAVMEYLQTRSWSNDTVNGLLTWMTDNQATGDDAAKYFLKTREDIWAKWVPVGVAGKIKAAL